MTMRYDDKLNVSLEKFSHRKLSYFGRRLGETTCSNLKQSNFAVFHILLFEFRNFEVKMEHKNDKKNQKLLMIFADKMVVMFYLYEKGINLMLFFACLQLWRYHKPKLLKNYATNINL